MLKKVFKAAGYLLLALVALIAGLAGWLSLKKPAQHAASMEKVEATPERLARGKYLVENVADCLGCHSEHVDRFSYPVKPGGEGVGGFAWDEKMGFPGYLPARNITPDRETGLGQWTDGEIIRAMREGINRKGEALFPIMPYQHLRVMSDEDAKSVVAYLRTLPARHKAIPDRKLQLPLNFIVKFMPEPLNGPVAAPDRKDTVAYGKYLTRIGGCYECHTPHQDKGGVVAEKEFAGGWEMHGPWGRNFTANLTPHPDTFIGRATKQEFIGRFRAYANMTAETAPAVPRGRNTIMPWLAFSKMTDEDLGAIYDYLKTVKPVENRVVTFPDAAM